MYQIRDIHQLRNDPLAMEIVRARARFLRSSTMEDFTVARSMDQAISDWMSGFKHTSMLQFPGHGYVPVIGMIADRSLPYRNLIQRPR